LAATAEDILFGLRRDDASVGVDQDIFLLGLESLGEVLLAVDMLVLIPSLIRWSNLSSSLWAGTGVWTSTAAMLLVIEE
jgi:hypothetical protein